MKLVRLADKHFKIVMESYTIEGNWQTVKEHMLRDLDMDMDEIGFALECMTLKSHDTAHFGINRCFIYTSDSKAVDKVLAELKAIQSVKQELVTEFQRDKDGAGFKYAQSRLLNLALTLDLERAIELIESEQGDVAA